MTYDEYLLKRAKEMRQNPTQAEKDFLVWCKKHNYQPRTQHIVKISDNCGYILDFYFANRKIAVEIDGSVHTSEEQLARDKERQRNLAKIGIYTIRLWNKEVDNKNLDRNFANKMKYATKVVKKLNKTKKVS